MENNVSLDFLPIRGQEQKILNQVPFPGALYFATDTGKMYMDVEDEATGELIHKSIGGSGAAILYGKTAKLNELPDGTFLLTKDDLENNEASVNMDDLIINIDGKFLRVSSLQGDGSFICSLLAVSGTGGGGGSGGGGGVTLGSAAISSLINQSFAYRYGDQVYIKFKFSSTYADGTPSGSAIATLHVNNGVAVHEVEIAQGENEIEVSKFLNVGRQRLTIRAQADIGGAAPQIVTYTWIITATELVLTWDYDISTLNSSNSTYKLKWYVAGDGVDKTTHIIVDGNEAEGTKVVTTANSKNEEKDMPGLSHGVHTVEMYMDAVIGLETLPTPRKKYQLIFVNDEEISPVIAYNLLEDAMQQYDTTTIEVVAYDPGSQDGKTNITIREDDIDIDTLKDVNNGGKVSWNYTPTAYGEKKITFVCGTTEVYFNIQVVKIDLGDTEETAGYAFKLKASDLSSNAALQSWSAQLSDSIYNNWAEEDKTVNLTFSENFDWINGGLQQEELPEGGRRNYICVRAGTTMTINYDLFKMISSTVRSQGKSFKFIFKATNCRDYDARVLSCYNQGLGLQMNAQGATLIAGGETLSTPYCEDNYIEFEFDIWPQETGDKGRRYMMFWMDGVPTGIKVYAADSSLEQAITVPITIGSEDCDINIYLVKVYEKHLDDNEHLNNFIMDAYSANEMMARFLRNDILESGRISYSKLVERNPECQAYLYDIPRMTKNKNDKVGTGDGGADDYINYMMYENTSTTPALTAQDVVMKVQGTSSARYGVAAFNYDTEFKSGFTTSSGEHIDAYAMNENSIPVDYFCTKVNVASSEGANNALNQEWYNKFQPWRNRLRRKNSKARDCMEFKPGIVFFRDRNKTKATDSNGVATDYDTRNVFEDTEGYIQNPYYKMYSVACMGNSKDNVEVLHDITNPYECCVEVADNQEPGQWMTTPQGVYVTRDESGKDVTVLVSINPYSTLDDSTVCPDGQVRSNRELWEAGLDEVCEFRYPDGISDFKDKFATWTDTDKAKWDLASLKEEGIITDEIIAKNPYDSGIEGWFRFVSWMARNDPSPKYTLVYIGTENAFGNNRPLYSYNEESGEYIELNSFSEPGLYYKVEHPYGYTNLPLQEPVTYGPHTFKTINEDPIKGYNNGSLAKLTISTYAGTYTHDTYEYRMAKMLDECEDYLCMESVVFHYLFIERHTMVDNVAKNTFWSTEDGLHWNLTKNYDNDTADGNDNQGRLSLTYGIECLDIKDPVTQSRYFNAHQSVWFNFINGLYAARQTVFKECNQRRAWNAMDYLKDFNDWQSKIPERCWIEDYYRKYRRPRELGLDSESFYMGMLEGGKKTHQRAQYETYQESYINSLYNADNYEGSVITIRSDGFLPPAYDPEFPGQTKGLKTKLYADGYIRAKIGSTESIPIRAKKGEEHTIRFYTKINDGIEEGINLGNATFYIGYASNLQALTEIGIASPTQIILSLAPKLREIDINSDPEMPNNVIETIGFGNNPLLESIKAQYCPKVNRALDLSSLKNLREIYTDGSTFTEVTFADGGMLETAHLNNITKLTMKNLRKVSDFSIEDYKRLRSIDIVNSNIDTYGLIKNIKSTIGQEGASELTILSYNIQGADWKVDEEDGNIALSTGNIPVLDYLGNAAAADPIGEATKAQSLTSKLTFGPAIIPSETYSAIDYYNKYINKDEFANFDIEFKGQVTPLVQIKDASGAITWKRRIVLNGEITLDFLTNDKAPSGIFTKPTDYNDAKNTYTFKNKWNVYSLAGALLTAIPIEGEMPIGFVVNQDVIVEPVIEKSLRKFDISFYNADGSLLDGYPVQAEYGSVASAAAPITAPQWNGEEPSRTYYTYKFKGYAVNNGKNQIIDLSTIEITSTREFIAVYEESHVYLNPLDEKYFNINASTGRITLKSSTTIKGKITVPKVVNGVVVKGLGTGCFQNGHESKNTSAITHIFFEPLEIITSASGEIESYKENTNIEFLGLNCVNGITSLQAIEVPPSIKEVYEPSGWIGGHRETSIVLSPDMKVLPNYMFNSYTGKLIMKDDFTNGVNSNTIKLPKLESIGLNAFEGATGIQNLTFELPNVLSFGEYIGEYCGSLVFGQTGTVTEPNFTWLLNEAEEGSKVWGANTITLYDPTVDEGDAGYQFIATYLDGTISYTN